MNKKTLKKFKLVFSFLFRTLLLLGLSLFLFADSLAALALFHPWKMSPGWKPTTENCEEVYFTTDDGLRLHGLYFPLENARGVILYSHGNGDTVKSCEKIMDFYRKEFQVALLVYDYRGYGRSEGKPTTAGIFRDGRAARRWVAQRENIKESQVIQMGFSFGGAVAVDLASCDGARALIVQSSFTSLVDMASKIFPFLPSGLFLREKMESFKKIGHYQGPVFLSHGTTDHIVPYKQGERLYEAAANPKTFYRIEQGEHSPVHTEEYLGAIRSFMDELVDIENDGEKQ